MALDAMAVPTDNPRMEPRRIPLLDDIECQKVEADVARLERYWTSRHDRLPSFTLGAAAYLDIPGHSHSQYFTRATRTNRPLKRDLAWLYERLVAALHVTLDAPVALSPTYAAPGFHIFRWHERLGELEPKLHFDLQHEHLDWAVDPNGDPTRRFSFTVPITIPADGAGVYIWPIPRELILDKTDDELEALRAEHSGTYHPYRAGELFVHDGNHLHRIANDRAMVDGESRMTFQGHGVRVDEGWLLYW